jgi:bifunctional enzyme CysN/CysC
MLDAGVILVVSASELTQADVELIKTTVEPDRIQVVWAGENRTTDVVIDLKVAEPEGEEAVEQVKRLLQEKGIIFRPW